MVVLGLKVKHNKFGIGKVTNKTKETDDGRYQIQVKFTNGGVKTYQAPMVFDNKFLTLMGG